MKKLLLTGFEPFGGEPVNPAVEAVRRLQGRVIGSFEIVGLELPTVFGQSTERLLTAIQQYEPEVVIALGQAGGRPARMFPRASPMRRARAYSTKVMPKRFLNWRRAVDASTESCRKSSSLQRFSGFASTASTSMRSQSDTWFGWDNGRQKTPVVLTPT